jgi:murein DD-endopeptidase MepM/ murein hydrolase activator NlpD
MRVLFLYISKAWQEQRHNIFRLAAVLFLYGVFAFGLSPFFTGLLPISQQAQKSGVSDTGVGGGGYPEDIPEGIIVLEGQNEANWPAETGMLEPESFSKPRMLLYSSYSIQSGDYIGGLATNFGLNEDTLISVNNIKNTRLIQAGKTLHIPNQDGILYTVKQGDTLETISEKHKADTAAIRLANELFSDFARAGTVLFIPGARLDWMERQEINGDLFMWPASGRITSNYGWRRWPFGGGNVRQFHSGLDIGASWGTPVRAAMSGRVTSAGWDDVLGNFVVVSHHSGYRTMYGHLSAIRVKSGAYVGTGERVGDVGSTGMSTGPHLHFTVYKNGVTVNPRTLMR